MTLPSVLAPGPEVPGLGWYRRRYRRHVPNGRRHSWPNRAKPRPPITQIGHQIREDHPATQTTIRCDDRWAAENHRVAGAQRPRLSLQHREEKTRSLPGSNCRQGWPPSVIASRTERSANDQRWDNRQAQAGSCRIGRSHPCAACRAVAESAWLPATERHQTQSLASLGRVAFAGEAAGRFERRCETNFAKIDEGRFAGERDERLSSCCRC